MTKEYNDFPSTLIDGIEKKHDGTLQTTSINTFTGEVLWQAPSSNDTQINRAVESAKNAQKKWRRISYEQRKSVVHTFTQLVQKHANALTELVAIEAGKPIWEAKIEVNALVTKFAASTDAYENRCAEFGREVKGRQSKTRFIPHGVMVVLGPFNFPLSMANGHIMPAVLAGNSIVFKPSELTSLSGMFMAKLWNESGLPSGIVNCITGGAETGKALVNHDDVSGVLFVGSHRVGMSILRDLVERPEKITALEMGGNSPLVVNDILANKLDSAVVTTIQSCLISSGQRCSASRRLIVKDDLDNFISRLVETCSTLGIGSYQSAPEPFYGTMIRPESAQLAMKKFNDIVKAGGVPLLTPTLSGPVNSVMTPGIIDMSNCSDDSDEEIFGPIIKVYRYKNLVDAIDMSNDTRFGLASGIICKDRSTYDEFYDSVKSGIVNWNQPLTGATTFAPFGGVGQSGNFRPAGYLSADYCSYAVASFEVAQENLTTPNVNGINI